MAPSQIELEHLIKFGVVPWVSDRWLQDGNTRKPMAQALNRNGILEGGPPRMSSREYMKQGCRLRMIHQPQDPAADLYAIYDPRLRVVTHIFATCKARPESEFEVMTSH